MKQRMRLSLGPIIGRKRPASGDAGKVGNVERHGVLDRRRCGGKAQRQLPHVSNHMPLSDRIQVTPALLHSLPNPFPQTTTHTSQGERTNIHPTRPALITAQSICILYLYTHHKFGIPLHPYKRPLKLNHPLPKRRLAKPYTVSATEKTPAQCKDPQNEGTWIL